MDVLHVAVLSLSLGNQSRLRGVRVRLMTLHPRGIYLLLFLLLQFPMQLIDLVAGEIATTIFPIQPRWILRRKLTDFFHQAFVEIFAPKLTVYIIFYVTSLPTHIARHVGADECGRSRSIRVHSRIMQLPGVST